MKIIPTAAPIANNQARLCEQNRSRENPAARHTDLRLSGLVEYQWANAKKKITIGIATT
jgi:hypothetical protein